MTYSHADERAQVPPPEPCLRCTHMQVFSTSSTTRHRCGAELHLQHPCMQHRPLPDGRKAEASSPERTPT